MGGSSNTKGPVPPTRTVLEGAGVRAGGGGLGGITGGGTRSGGGPGGRLPLLGLLDRSLDRLRLRARSRRLRVEDGTPGDLDRFRFGIYFGIPIIEFVIVVT